MRTIILAFAIIATLSNTAYAETIKATVNGMVCAFCAAGIEKTFKGKPEIETVSVDLDQKLVTIHTKDGQTITNDQIKKTIADAGYSVDDIKRDKQ